MLPPLSGVFRPSTEFLISGFSFSSSSGWRRSSDWRAGPRHAAWRRARRRYRLPSRKCFVSKLTFSECYNWRNSFPDPFLRHDWQRGDAFDWCHSLRRYPAVTLSRRRHYWSEKRFCSSTEIQRLEWPKIYKNLRREFHFASFIKQNMHGSLLFDKFATCIRGGPFLVHRPWPYQEDLVSQEPHFWKTFLGGGATMQINL